MHAPRGRSEPAPFPCRLEPSRGCANLVESFWLLCGRGRLDVHGAADPLPRYARTPAPSPARRRSVCLSIFARACSGSGDAHDRDDAALAGGRRILARIAADDVIALAGLHQAAALPRPRPPAGGCAKKMWAGGLRVSRCGLRLSGQPARLELCGSRGWTRPAFFVDRNTHMCKLTPQGRPSPPRAWRPAWPSSPDRPPSYRSRALSPSAQPPSCTAHHPAPPVERERRRDGTRAAGVWERGERREEVWGTSASRKQTPEAVKTKVQIQLPAPMPPSCASQAQVSDAAVMPAARGSAPR